MWRVAEDEGREEAGQMRITLDELAREGARRMLVAALEAEVEAYVSGHREVRDAVGRAQVVRNGYGRLRRVTLGTGTIAVQPPPRGRSSGE